MYYLQELPEIFIEDKKYYSQQLKSFYDELETLSRQQERLESTNENYNNYLILNSIKNKKSLLKCKINELLDLIF